uniref:Uncharacterized protein n=1 Tax=Gossypium raimondii TaxID=29730 RepID=A0A0D2RS68_GOSRA|nr:hypothetical protein B456_004G023700 [Gossypium raimondii]KJB21970.1 hypothetical protein B456_004G023700 [Gossypium raimondii]
MKYGIGPLKLFDDKSSEFVASVSKPWPSNLEIKSKSPLKERSRWVKLTDWLKNFDEMVPLKSLSARLSRWSPLT